MNLYKIYIYEDNSDHTLNESSLVKIWERVDGSGLVFNPRASRIRPGCRICSVICPAIDRPIVCVRSCERGRE